MEVSNDNYNKSLSKILKVLTEQKHDQLCCKRIFDMWHSGDMSWENYHKLYSSLEKLTEDLKNVILTKIARDINYKVSEVLQGSKKFMSHDDYLDTVEKTI